MNFNTKALSAGIRRAGVLSIFASVLVSSAFADSIFTQTVTIPSQQTDVSFANTPALFNLFGSIGAPAGSTLQSVTLLFTITETLNSLTLTNNDTKSETARYTAQAVFDAGDSQSAADATALDNALANNNANFPGATVYSSPSVTLSAGQSISTFSALPKTLTETTGSVLGTTSAYTGAGTFDLMYLTNSSFTITGGGNNVAATQATVTGAVATVIYDYSPPSATPEPATTFLVGGGLIALSLVGRRRLVRK